MSQEIKDNQEIVSKGVAIARTLRPFIATGAIREPDKVLEAIAKDIDREFQSYEDVVLRTRQFLSSIDYFKLTDHQGKVCLLLERAIKKVTE